MTTALMGIRTTDDGSGVRGTQSLRRALALLRLVARRGDGGVRLTQLVKESGLDRSTTYRLMSCLVEEQFIDRDDDQRYHLGPEAVLLGSLLPSPTPLITRFIPAMKRIARIAGDTTFLMIRQGDFVQCAHREVGSSLVKVLTTNIGQRRLLGTGTCGVAVLGFMTAAEITLTHQRNAAEYAERHIGLDRLLAMGTAVRERDCAITFEAFEVGVAGIGVAFKLGEHAMGAISIATLTLRFGPERQHALQKLLTSELQQLDLHT
ncbi:IclR family transcriptional regulator [Schauerella aestuarii]|uniref:IclR family transcriptional regulator n=1 Tax=Schauerella aestuarii TaxID=2511204 RepID=UPI001369AFF4|nr:helix-turn-helix domain-containing protein [Achromobacter aestuarii]